MWLIVKLQQTPAMHTFRVQRLFQYEETRTKKIIVLWSNVLIQGSSAQRHRRSGDREGKYHGQTSSSLPRVQYA